jgi:hypothetical protein
MRQWAEAMLAATIWFLREELGIKTIFYHTFDSGCRLKGIEDTLPPRSLYTVLPKKFCFEETDRLPGFLALENNKRMRRIKRENKLRFFLLEM